MSRGKASGISLTNKDASIVLGMAARGDREHDIAAWFGVNQGRVAEVKKGSHGPTVTAAAATDLPPKGPPGLKGRRLYASVTKALEVLKANGENSIEEVAALLKEGVKKYESHEA
jgi:hypothetical protein